MRGFRGGMMGGGGFRMGRKFAAGDLQLVILALLAEQPRHGYELIKLLEERSGGFYVPSPGVIYPALTYLEETGLAEVEAEGTKKLYRITESGRKQVEENSSMIDMTLGKLERIGEKMAHVRRIFDPESRGPESRGGEREEEAFPEDKSEVVAARMLLKSALKLRYPWSKDEAKRIAGILERAAAEILQQPRND
ncbi:PadR family transcriptional regulator [Rhizobium sp. AN80A]|uniref:PadR family transcriptional regulator n=1 Tax=Rhizobium sp. AN80A TaxID=3040673 RepID=UPI0024B34D0E|nr:PadR family transcriptional regulator [Rhizobium sp. AN80A]